VEKTESSIGGGELRAGSDAPIEAGGATASGSVKTEPVDPLRPFPGPTEAQLALLIYHRHGMQVAVLTPGEPSVLGREPPSTVLVPDLSLSREHARFTLTGDTLVVEDLHSANGTWVGGTRVETAEVRPTEEIRLGLVSVRMHTVGPAGASALGLEDHDAFRQALEREVVRAKHFRRPSALLMIRSADQPSAHVSGWCARVRSFLRPIDRVGFYGADVLEAILPEVGPVAAEEMARLIARSGLPGEPRLAVGVATFPDSAADPESLLAACRAAALRAGAAQVRSAPVVALVRASKPEEHTPDDSPVIASASMRAVFDQLAAFARAKSPVLIQGETGTGKELAARELHDRSGRRGRLVYLNCGAIPGELVESVFFGHERGAFTGASEQKKGAFEEATGGTLVLDELGELPPAAQVTLLRVLENGRVTRVGSTKEIPVDVRVVAATNCNLDEMVKRGAFRRDLLFRLNAIDVRLPALRARRSDIRPLVDRFLARANEANDRQVRAVRPDAMALLEGYSWPGNVRELRNVIDRAVVIAEGDEIIDQDLPDVVRNARSGGWPAVPAPLGPPPALQGPPTPRVVRHVSDVKELQLEEERGMIRAALRETNGNQKAAAARIGMSLRTLSRRIAALGLKDRP
jgi:DNA-binding NtrC family response regulator